MFVATTLLRALNHKPRPNRGGKSRVHIYHAASPNREQIEQARADLERRLKRQQRDRDTATARQNPTVRNILDEAFDRLRLADPR